MATGSWLLLMMKMMMVVVVSSQADDKRGKLVKPHDCKDLREDFGQDKDGVYTVFVGDTYLRVYCDMTTDGGGWTVFQRRQDGSENFYRTWNKYKNGFGNVTEEFWLGNDILHLLTSDKRQQLRIELGDWERNRRFAKYDNFKVGSAEEKYKLISLGKYTGNVGDALRWHTGMMFSTLDQDNDRHGSKKCARVCPGGWWYNMCISSNLNGLYLDGGVTKLHAMGIDWYYWKKHYYSLKFTEMKIKPYE